MDTPAPAAAPSAPPPYGGGQEEFACRSRTLRWCMTGMGILFFAMGLWMTVMASSSFRHEAPAEFTIHYLLTGSFAANSLGLLIMGSWIAIMPWTSLRRGRRRAADWRANRQAGPYYTGGSLLPMAAAIVAWNLQVGFVVAGAFLLVPSIIPLLPALVVCVVGQLLGLVAFAWILAAMRRRRYFRSWRLQIAEFPVLPGRSVEFQVSRCDGRPLDPGLRLALKEGWTSRAGRWLIGHFFRRSVGGDVEIIADAAAPGVVRGTLQIDDAGLSLAPPPDGCEKDRVFAFLHVKQGGWMKCRFEVPLPAVYFRRT
jgi:hypothetical protein